jgi:hypothetical protein
MSSNVVLLTAFSPAKALIGGPGSRLMIVGAFNLTPVT